MEISKSYILLIVVITFIVGYGLGYSVISQAESLSASQIADRIEYMIFDNPHSLVTQYMSDDTTIGDVKWLYTFNRMSGVSRGLLENIAEYICFGEPIEVNQTKLIETCE